MTTRLEALNKEKLPKWIPDKIQRVLIKEAFRKEPIDLMSEEVIGKNFASKEEILDVIEIIKPIKNTTLIGMHGSRANLKRPPLFENEKSFSAYHKNKTFEYGISMISYEMAKKDLKKGFNDNYKKGLKYPKHIVELLVSDIDLLIIAGDKNIHGGPYVGKKTNATIEIDICSPYEGYWKTKDDLTSFLSLVKKTIPLKYK